MIQSNAGLHRQRPTQTKDTTTKLISGLLKAATVLKRMEKYSDISDRAGSSTSVLQAGQKMILMVRTLQETEATANGHSAKVLRASHGAERGSAVLRGQIIFSSSMMSCTL